jgi:hypothetical protein
MDFLLGRIFQVQWFTKKPVFFSYQGSPRDQTPHPTVPPGQNNTSTSTRDNSTTMSSIEAALTAIESLGPGEQPSYRKFARDYGCSRAALAQRHQGVSTSRAVHAQNQQAVHPQQEQELLQCIKRLTRQSLPPTQAMIQNFGTQIARRELGKNLVDLFVQRYPDDFILKWTTAIDNNRHKADSGKKHSIHSDLLRDKIDQYHVEARHISNMDEKGFMLGVVGRLKRISSRALYEDGKRTDTI